MIFRKFLLTVVAFSIAAPAYAASSTAKLIVCSNEQVQDASYSASFEKPFENGATVQLTIPIGESDTKTLTGSCVQNPSYSAIALICVVAETGSDGYVVTLSPAGSGEYKATYSGSNQELEYDLPNCRKQ